MSKYARTILPALLVALSPLLAASAMADSLKADGFKYSDEVTVVGIKEGQLQTTIKGSEKLFDLATVESIDLTGQQRFNEAELARKDAKKAAALYKSALGNINDRKLKLLAEARAIAPTDADGKFTEAMTYFLDVYAASPTEGIWKLHPTNLPPASSSMLKDAAEKINVKLASIKGDEARKNLKTLQLDILTKAGDPKAATLARELKGGNNEPTASTPAPEAAAPVATAAEGLEGVSNALHSKNYDAVITQADNLLKTATGDTAVRLFELKAQAYEGQK